MYVIQVFAQALKNFFAMCFFVFEMVCRDIGELNCTVTNCHTCHLIHGEGVCCMLRSNFKLTADKLR